MNTPPRQLRPPNSRRNSRSQIGSSWVVYPLTLSLIGSVCLILLVILGVNYILPAYICISTILIVAFAVLAVRFTPNIEHPVRALLVGGLTGSCMMLGDNLLRFTWFLTAWLLKIGAITESITILSRLGFNLPFLDRLFQMIGSVQSIANLLFSVILIVYVLIILLAGGILGGLAGLVAYPMLHGARLSPRAQPPRRRRPPVKRR